MSVAILGCRAQIGVNAPPVTIEVFLTGGLPTFSIVGMPEKAVRESKDRVRGAIQSAGFKFPLERIIVNLGPAEMRKGGGRFDLPIALGILVASRIIPRDAADGFEFYGELALNGDIRSVPGILPSALRAAQSGVPVFVPAENAEEATLTSATVYAVKTLQQVVSYLKGDEQQQPSTPLPLSQRRIDYPDLADVRGQLQAKRALEIAAAGGHNILFTGPPGTGKSMLAQRMPGILPPPTDQESMQCAAIDSVLGRPLDLARWGVRPFRSPHHTASAAALVGGGSEPRPGEISRAHNGVLFLDELPEFSRHVLEVLREPMETGCITISRAGRQADFPARFQLVAAMNPCPCGYLGDPQSDCRCSAERVNHYRSKISGPLLDRIDIQVNVLRPPKKLLRPDARPAEASKEVLKRVIAARQRQQTRNQTSNAVLEGKQLQKACTATAESWDILEKAMDTFAMSARAHQRIWRVARTIADLADIHTIDAEHVSEALSLRYLDRTV